MEKKIAEFDNNKKLVICLEINEFYIYEKNKSPNILGIYTHGIATCSSIIISFNDDSIVFMGHLIEDSKIEQIINQKIIPILKNKKIVNINIIYSKGVNGLYNSKKESQINDVIKTIDNYFLSKKIVYEHKNLTSCFKIIKTNNAENKTLINNLVNDKISKINRFSKKVNKEAAAFINEELSFLRKSVYEKELVLFSYFDIEQIQEISKKYNFELL